MSNGTDFSYHRLLNVLKDAYKEQRDVEFTFDQGGPVFPVVHDIRLAGNITKIVEREGFRDEDLATIYVDGKMGSLASAGNITISSKNGKFEKDDEEEDSYYITYTSDLVNAVMDEIFKDENLEERPDLRHMKEVGVGRLTIYIFD